MGFKALFNRKKLNKKSNDSPPSTATVTPPRTNHPDHINELDQVFKKFDVNGDGKISSSELRSIMSSLGHDATEEELQNMITEFDADGDGFIDFDEFVAMNTKGLDNDGVMENLKDAFKVYDIDGNGSITADELHKVMASLGEQCSIAECKQMISGIDSDGDGMIDFEEFKVMMMMGARWDSMESFRGNKG